jgi:hypothetical protein
MMKALVSIAVLAATLDSSALANLNDKAASRKELYIRRLGKSGKEGKAEVHPDLHHHGYHPHHIGKSGKAETGGKSAKGAVAVDHGWAAVGDDDDDDDDHSVGDDGYKWSGDGNTTSMDVSDVEDVAMHPIEEEVHHHHDDDDDSADDDDDGDDDDWWADDGHYGKSGKGAKGSKGAKSAKGGKSGKAVKSGKGVHYYDDGMHHHWGSWSADHSHMPSSDIPSPAPTPCGKAGKDCPIPAPKPTPPQTLPPICLTIPCSINGVLVSPTDVTSGSKPATTQPPVPSPIGTVTTNPPVEGSVEAIVTTPPEGSTDPTVSDVIGVPPPPPPTAPTPPTALVPITVAPSTPTQSGYPTWAPSFMPTTSIDFLTESASWFQTGKAYEVDSYTRARMGDQKNDIGFSFAKQEDTSGSIRRLTSSIVSGFGMLILLFQVVG